MRPKSKEEGKGVPYFRWPPFDKEIDAQWTDCRDRFQVGRSFVFPLSTTPVAAADDDDDGYLHRTAMCHNIHYNSGAGPSNDRLTVASKSIGRPNETK